MLDLLDNAAIASFTCGNPSIALTSKFTTCTSGASITYRTIRVSNPCVIVPMAGQTTRLYSKSAIDVDVEELDCLLSEERVQLFDVREPSELLETGKIPRSVNIPRMF